MKQLIFFSLFSVIIVSTGLTPTYSQAIFPIDETTGQIIYTEVVNVDSVNSDDLFVRAHGWFANTFKSAQSVIQLNDKEAGKLIGKGFFEAGIAKSNAGVVHLPMVVTVHFTVQIQTKDGRYKYDFTNFSCLRFEGTDLETDYNLLSSSVIKNGMWQRKLDQDWIEIKKDINARMLNIIADLKKSMNTNTGNW